MRPLARPNFARCTRSTSTTSGSPCDATVCAHVIWRTSLMTCSSRARGPGIDTTPTVRCAPGSTVSRFGSHPTIVVEPVSRGRCRSQRSAGLPQSRERSRSWRRASGGVWSWSALRSSRMTSGWSSCVTSWKESRSWRSPAPSTFQRTQHTLVYAWRAIVSPRPCVDEPGGELEHG